MPANLTPDYKAAEAAFRRARDPGERLGHLKEMLRLIPKHKGTEHLQAEIKRRIKELSTEQAATRGGARTGPPTYIAPEGAAQISLLGPPNSGKSTLHRALTGSHTEIGPYPFTTQFPQPGMYVFDDIPLQLVDLPPISKQHPIPWIVNALQPADGCLLIVDLGHPACVDQMIELHDVLDERRIVLSARWPGDRSPPAEADEEEDSFATTLPALLIAGKSDARGSVTEELAILEELTGYTYPMLAASAETGEGLDEIGGWLARKLEIVRVYTKVPGRAPDMTRPFTVRSGQTVADVARLVHREMAEEVKYARVWGRESFDGQQVGREHLVADGDVLELHI
jgi:ribosome-interacting GTPase 1